MDTILIAFIVKFIDPIQFVVAALVVWFAFRDNNKMIILYAAVAASLVNLVVMNAVSITSPRGISLLMSFPAALVQASIVYALRSRKYRRKLVDSKNDESQPN